MYTDMYGIKYFKSVIILIKTKLLNENLINTGKNLIHNLCTNMKVYWPCTYSDLPSGICLLKINFMPFSLLWPARLEVGVMLAER